MSDLLVTSNNTALFIAGGGTELLILPAAPSLTINTPVPQTISTTFDISGTYANGTPSGFTFSFSTGGGSGTVASPTISGASWSGTVPVPTSPNTYTLTITGQGGNTASATTEGFSVGSAGETTVTTFTLTGTSGGTQTNAVVELALPMAPGILASGSAVSMSGPSGISPTQADLTTTDKQSNIRWQKLAAVIPSLADSSQTATLTAASGSSASGTAIQPADLLNSSYHIGGTGNDNFECLVSCTFPNGNIYTASARAGLGASSTWTYGAAQYVAAVRSGPFISEFVCRVPLVYSGTADEYLLAEFHITAAKAGSGAINDSTNPILWTNTRVILYNGYIVQSSQVGGSPIAASQAPKVFDLEVQNGLNSPITVYQLTGGTGPATLTLTSSNGGSTLWGGVQTRNDTNDFLIATLASGTWTPKTWGTNGSPGTTAGDNSNDCGKAVVELSGSASGIGWILDVGPVSTGVSLTSRQAGLLVPEDHAFSSSTVTSWKKMGVFLAYGSRLQPYAKFSQGTVPQYTAVLTTAYILSTEMVPNFAATAAQAPIADYEGPFADGSHPLSASIAANASARNFSYYEEQTGLTDAIGVFPESQTAALLNWDSDYSLAYQVMAAQGQVTSIKNVWFLDEFQGTLGGPDKSICYMLPYLGGAVAQTIGYSTNNAPWAFSTSHSGDASYLPWLLTGELCHLQGKIAMAIFYGQADNYTGLLFGDLTNGGYAINSSGTPSTVFTLSSGTLEYGQGECVVLKNGTAGGYLPSPGIYYILPLTSNTFSVYDTYAHAIAGGSTGLQTLNNYNGGYLSNGFDYSIISEAWQAGGIRFAAWQYRTQGQTAAAIPDSIPEAFVGIFNTQAQHRRWLVQFDLYNYVNFTDNSNFVALGPRFTVMQSNNPAYGEWHMNYYRIAAVNTIEALNPAAGDNGYEYLIWMLNSPIQAVVNADVVPGAISCSYYVTPCNLSGTVTGYSWWQFYTDFLLYGEARSGNCIPYTSGTLTISGSSQSALTVSSSVALWDGANPSQYVGQYIAISGVECVISSVTSSTQAAVAMSRGTLATGTVSFTPTNGSLSLAVPPATNPTLYDSSYFSYTSQQNAAAGGGYGAMSRTGIEIEKQFLSAVGETSANYKSAVSWFDNNNFPDPYNPGGPDGILQVNYFLRSRS